MNVSIRFQFNACVSEAVIMPIEITEERFIRETELFE